MALLYQQQRPLLVFGGDQRPAVTLLWNYQMWLCLWDKLGDTSAQRSAGSLLFNQSTNVFPKDYLKLSQSVGSSDYIVFEVDIFYWSNRTKPISLLLFWKFICCLPARPSHRLPPCSLARLVLWFYYVGKQNIVTSLYCNVRWGHEVCPAALQMAVVLKT